MHRCTCTEGHVCTCACEDQRTTLAVNPICLGVKPFASVCYLSQRICAVSFWFSWTGTLQGSVGLQSRPWGLSLSAWEIGPRKTEKQPPHLRTHEPEPITTAFYPPPPDHAGEYCTVPAPMGGETKGRRLFSQHLTPAGLSLLVFICSPEFLDF